MKENEVGLGHLDRQDREFALLGYHLGELSVTQVKDRGLVRARREHSLTGVHESTHALAALGVGWDVLKITVIRWGNILGATFVRPGRAKTEMEMAQDQITIAVAGMIGEEMVGHQDHSGACSDLGKAWAIDSYLSELLGMARGSFVSAGKAMARWILSGETSTSLWQRGMILSRSGVR